MLKKNVTLSAMLVGFVLFTGVQMRAFQKKSPITVSTADVLKTGLPTEVAKAYAKVAAAFATVAVLYNNAETNNSKLQSVACTAAVAALAYIEQANSLAARADTSKVYSRRDAKEAIDKVFKTGQDAKDAFHRAKHAFAISDYYQTMAVRARARNSADEIQASIAAKSSAVCASNVCMSVKLAAEKAAQAFYINRTATVSKQLASNDYIDAATNAAMLYTNAADAYKSAASAFEYAYFHANTPKAYEIASNISDHTESVIAASREARDAYCFYTSKITTTADAHAVCAAYEALNAFELAKTALKAYKAYVEARDFIPKAWGISYAADAPVKAEEKAKAAHEVVRHSCAMAFHAYKEANTLARAAAASYTTAINALS